MFCYRLCTYVQKVTYTTVYEHSTYDSETIFTNGPDCELDSPTKMPDTRELINYTQVLDCFSLALCLSFTVVLNHFSN